MAPEWLQSATDKALARLIGGDLMLSPGLKPEDAFTEKPVETGDAVVTRLDYRNSDGKRLR